MNVKFLGTCLFTASLLFSGAAAAQGCTGLRQHYRAGASEI